MRNILVSKTFFGLGLIVLALALVSCSFSSERVTPFSGRMVTVSGQTPGDTLPVDLAEIVGYVIYDKQTDGLFNDTAVFYGAGDGSFGGLLQYETPVNVTAPRLRKYVHLLFPELQFDTFLTVDVYRTDSDIPDKINEWEPFVRQSDR